MKEKAICICIYKHDTSVIPELKGKIIIFKMVCFFETLVLRLISQLYEKCYDFNNILNDQQMI